MSEVVSAFSRKNIFGYRAVAYSSLGIAFVGFFAWGHHMFLSGQSSFDGGVFSVLSMLVGVFTAIKVFNWVGTVYRGAVDFKTPFAYFCGFLYFTVFGGMTGIAVATMSLDVSWHDTYFVVAHFHFIMVGASMTAFLAALHYWFPKMSGRVLPRQLSRVAAVFVFIGFCLTFVPQFLLGNGGMPRRYYEYPPHFQALHVVSTIGAYILGLALFVILAYTIHALVRGAASTANPWASASFEWRTASPPPRENFLGQPDFARDAYDYGVADQELHVDEKARAHV
jgi:cytochrome c oxidase subunit 1